MLKKALDHARQNHPRYLVELTEFLRIPSISTLPEHKGDIQRAAEWLAEDLERIGMDKVQIIPTAGNPVVYGEWMGAGEDALTILIYGHYDVQPVDPLELWESPPFEPEIREGRIYARGASDNKAQHFSHVKAIETVLAANGALPVNVKLCLDGEEEVGSVNLPPFVREYKDLLATDSILISDGPMISEGQPTAIYAMRGVASFDLVVKGPNRDLHSGNFGGSVHNPVQALAEIITALHDEGGTVTIPGFYDDVNPLSEDERAMLAKASYSLSQWQRDTGLEKDWGEADYSLLERQTTRPTCEVNGIWGGYTGEGLKTIIPAEAGAKISVRLVAAQDPDKIARQFEEHIREIAPDGVRVELNYHQDGSAAAVTPYDSVEMKAALKAYRESWGIEPVISRLGGSLPIVATFQDVLDAPFVLMPLGLDDNRHSPNEHYRLEYFEKGIDTAIRYYYYLGKG